MTQSNKYKPLSTMVTYEAHAVHWEEPVRGTIIDEESHIRHTHTTN